MAMFNKKQKEKEMTLQECEQEFSKLQFEIGSYTYLIDLKSQEINKLNDVLNEKLEDMKKLAHKGVLLKNKVQGELEEAIKRGEKIESSLN